MQFRCEAAVVAAATLVCSSPAEGQVTPERPLLHFAARSLVILSDGDMTAQAYAGDVLGPPTPDAVSVVTIDATGQPVLAGTAAASNSVVGPPACVAVTPDGHYAIVVETRGLRPSDRPDAKLADLPPGRAITVIDLRDPAHPAIVQRIGGRPSPISVSVSPDGRRAAIAYDTSKSKAAPLDVYGFVDGRLDRPRSPALPGFGSDDVLKNVAFAPDGTLALVYATRPRLSLVRVAGDTLTRWGNDVPLGPTPFEVRFTPDGRFALVNDMTVPATGTDVRGSVTSIALAVARAADGVPVHRVVGHARTGVLPEGLAISPDGRWVATTNLERTAYAAGDPRQGGFASVTLMRIDQQGRLTRANDYPFAGVIPEGAAFDDTSRFLAVSVFDHLAPLPSRGSLDIWRLGGDFGDPARGELAPTGWSVPLPRGAHAMEIVR